VIVRVGRDGNEKPRFLTPISIEASVDEDASGGALVTKVEAYDPDGEDEGKVTYALHSGGN